MTSRDSTPPPAQEPLSDKEIAIVRSLVKGFTAAEWRVLKAMARAVVAARGDGGAPAGNGGATGGDELSDSFLDSQPWADREIGKDPKRWAGDSMKGYRYSEVPSEWLEVQAEALEYKAQKGRESATPRLQTKGKNAGKPWHEADSFEAKICRAWARRNRGKTLPPPRANGAADHGVGDDVGSSEHGDAFEEDFVP